MSEPRTVYRIGDQWGDGTHPKIMDSMVDDGWLVPVTVDDLLAAIPKCEHGKIDPHRNDINDWTVIRRAGNGEVAEYGNMDCPGAALGDTDET